jgi:ubiquinone/menaquinone biosynthesis C-methylase UbiE
MGKVKEPEFDALAEKYHSFMKTFGSHFYDEFFQYLPKRYEKALDAGCGPGDLSLLLSKYVNHVVGIDLSNSIINIAKRQKADQQKTNVDFLVADLENLPFREQSFDVVVSNYTLNHTSLEVTLPALRQLVKPGGRIIIRDLTTQFPRLDAFRFWRRLRILWNNKRFIRSYRFRTFWQTLSLTMSSRWIDCITSRNYRKLTPEAFRTIYHRFLPGCQLVRQHRWATTAVWEAPGENKFGERLLHGNEPIGTSL